MLKKWLCGLLGVVLLCTAFGTVQAFSAKAVGSKNFTFNGTMSKEVLRNYCSRAVSLAGLCVDGVTEDRIFEEDLRMIRRMGAKYIGRSAYYSWSGHMAAEDINKHFKIAQEKATIIHKADSEIILQAGVFEIIYKGTVNNTAIPAYVFKAFGLPVETRNFRYEDMCFPAGKYVPGYWSGTADSAVPCIAKQESQMYFYYAICRYIDAGYEAIHLGQAEMMMDYTGESNATEWDKVTTLARTYAKTHARRGIVLFDCHTALDSSGLKVGERLVCDIQAAAIVPNETKNANGAYQCEIGNYNDIANQWIGRSAGGQHPLGFTVENNFTILEFDNYGGNGRPLIATYDNFYVWGYDDITWFAKQPEWYRNQFLKECNQFLATHDLDTQGRQQYFLQPSCRRIISPEDAYPKLVYTSGKNVNTDFLLDYLWAENSPFVFDENTNKFSITVKETYRANRNSDACPNGFNQEDTIREIFLGKNAPEDPTLNVVILPAKYNTTAVTTTNTASGSKSNTTTKTTKITASTGIVNGDTSNTGGTLTTLPGQSSIYDEESVTQNTDSSSDMTTTKNVSNIPAGGSPLPWILAGVAVLVAGSGIVFWLLRNKMKAK